MQVRVENAQQLARMFQVCKFMTVQLCNEWQAHCEQLRAQGIAPQTQVRPGAPTVGPRAAEPSRAADEEEDSSSSSDGDEEEGSSSSDEDDQAQFVRAVRQRRQ